MNFHRNSDARARILSEDGLGQRVNGFRLLGVFVLYRLFCLARIRGMLLCQPPRELFTLLFDARHLLLALLERTTGSSCHT
jgi:hypothetical protein